jgi:hypothetical protein
MSCDLSELTPEERAWLAGESLGSTEAVWSRELIHAALVEAFDSGSEAGQDLADDLVKAGRCPRCHGAGGYVLKPRFIGDPRSGTDGMAWDQEEVPAPCGICGMERGR